MRELQSLQERIRCGARTLFGSFYAKLTLLLFAILTVSSAVQVTVFAEYARKLRLGSEQAIHAGLAKKIAADIEAKGVSLHETDTLEALLKKWTLSTPNVAAYILNTEGTPQFSTGKPLSKLKTVDLEDVREFLSGGNYPNFGVNPANPARREVFSAAKITMSEFQGYLYLVLESDTYRTGATGVANLFILRSVVYQALLGMLIAGGLGLILFSLLTKRLRSMSNVVEGFAKGARDIRIPVTGEDELDQLAHSFNTMADSIVASTQQIEEQDAMRRRLVANISHDLRSPLTTLYGYSETLAHYEQRLPESSKQEITEIIFNNAKHLKRLVEDLFSLSMLEARELSIEKTSFDISTCISDLLLSFDLRATEKNVNLRYEGSEQAIFVVADERLILRVLANLLENAVLHANEESAVTIKSEIIDGEVCISTTNFGPALSPTECQSILERFYRCDRGTMGKSEGAGLGLAIVKRILELHNTEIKVKSDPLSGTSFSFSLNLSDCSAV